MLTKSIQWLTASTYMYDKLALFVPVESKLQLNMYPNGGTGGESGGGDEHYLPVGALTSAQLNHAHSPLALPSAAVLNRQTTLS